MCQLPNEREVEVLDISSPTATLLQGILSLPDLILVRDEYRELFDFITREQVDRSLFPEEKDGGLVVTGQPGVGTTSSVTS